MTSHEIGDFITYNHPSGIFRLDVPNNWIVRDDSTSGLALTQVTSPDGKVLVEVAASLAPANASDAALGAQLQEFVERAAGHELDFSMDEPEPSDEDDTVGTSYSYERAGEVFAGDAFVWLAEQYAVCVGVAMPDDEAYEELDEVIDDIIDSLEIDAAAQLP